MDSAFFSDFLKRSLALDIQLRAVNKVGFEVGFGSVKTPCKLTACCILSIYKLYFVYL